MNKKATWLLFSLIFGCIDGTFCVRYCCNADPTAVPPTAVPPTDTVAPTTVPPTDTVAPTAVSATATVAPTAAPTLAPLTIGMILVGPYNDGGWSQATYEGVQYVESKIPGTTLVYVDNSFNLKTTPAQQAEQLLTQGAKVIIF